MATSPKSPKDIKKDTIYIDVDDEITTIIDKLQNSQQRIVALVLPKRAPVMQSIVNMKLLKRTAENAKKHVVLITSESGLLPLAGAVGLHVANSLQSKPAIPPAPDMLDREHVIDEDTGEEFDDFNPDAVADKPVGQLAGLAGVSAAAAEPETINMDNSDDIAPVSAAAAAGSAGAAGAAKKGKNKKLKIPNFNRFRLLLIIGAVVLLLLIAGFIYANIALTKAVVTLQTNSTDVDTKTNLTLDPKAKELDLETETAPAKIASKVVTGSQQVSTSGQKNNGTKASGSVTLSLNDCSADQVTIPSGTGLSASGQTFITQATATLQSVKVGGVCHNSDFKTVSTQAVSVVAQSAGAGYNIGASKFSVAGFSTTVSGQSSDPMSGGTDNIVKVVTQADIDSAKQKISGEDKDSSSIKDELSSKLSAEGYTAVAASLFTGDAVVRPSAAVGDQADTVTVTQTTTYTMYGAKEADIKKIITTKVRKQIDTSKQQILKDGYSTAKYDIATKVASGPLQATMTATSLAGPDIQQDRLAAELGGLKTGAVQQKVKSIPGVSGATVKYSPFWVSTVPKKPSKVEIVIEKAAGASKPADNDSSE